MKPEAIMESHILDIIFENRNKAYGAYALRRNYNLRLIQALGGTFLVVGLFVLLQSLKPKNDPSGNSLLIDERDLIVVDLQPDKPEEKQPQEEQPRQRSAPQPTIENTIPRITTQATETQVPSLEDMRNRVISDVTNNLPDGDGDPPFDPGEPAGTPGGSPAATPQPEPEPDIYVNPDVMPSFNGDIIRYMQRHLRQPDDIETGERITVRVRFVVNEEGNISDIQVIQSGRRDLDEEVVRVVKKMPRWNPGKQGGRAVPVFFNMPVTFVSNTE